MGERRQAGGETGIIGKSCRIGKKRLHPAARFDDYPKANVTPARTPAGADPAGPWSPRLAKVSARESHQRPGAGTCEARAPGGDIKCLMAKDLVILDGFSVENGDKKPPREPFIGKVRTIVWLPHVRDTGTETSLMTGVSDRERGTSSGFRGGSSAIRFLIAALPVRTRGWNKWDVKMRF
jgi:hypothetical protein